MTHDRFPTTEEAAVFEALDGIEDWEVMQWTGKTKGHFRKICNPENKWRVHFEDAIALDALLIFKHRPAIFGPLFERWLNSRVVEAGGKPRTRPAPFETLALHMTAELGDVADAIRKGGADGVYDKHELKRIQKEAGDVKAAAIKVEDAAFLHLEAIKDCADLDAKRKEAAAE